LFHSISYSSFQKRFKVDLKHKTDPTKRYPVVSDFMKDGNGVYDTYRPIRIPTEEDKVNWEYKRNHPGGPGGVEFWKTDNSYGGTTPHDVLQSLDVRGYIPLDVMAERMKIDFPPFEEYHDFSREATIPVVAGGSEEIEIMKTIPLPEKRIPDIQKQVATATGGRKSCTAVVAITPGSGKFFINGRRLPDYFPLFTPREVVTVPLAVTCTLGRFDVRARVFGGGFTGQSNAIANGLSKALQSWDPNHRTALKKFGLMERDERIVERKKYGQKKARKKFQWAKR